MCYGLLQRQNIISAQRGGDLHFSVSSGLLGRWGKGEGTLAPLDLLPQPAAPGAGGCVAWQERSLLARRCWGEETEALITLGWDTELCVNWPGDLRTAFLGLFLAAVHLAWLVEHAHCLFFFQSEADRKIEIKFVNCPTGLIVKFHKLHSFKVFAGGHLHSVLVTKGETKSFFGKSNRWNTKALGGETGLTFRCYLLWYTVTCYSTSSPNFWLEFHAISSQKNPKCLNLCSTVYKCAITYYSPTYN